MCVCVCVNQKDLLPEHPSCIELHNNKNPVFLSLFFYFFIFCYCAEEP